jgi:enoyl-[acyl-carrier protein] reductase I
MGEIQKLADACNAEVIPADATSVEDLENLITKSMEVLGGKIDFILHSIGMSPNVRKGKPYDGTNYDWYHKTMDVSAMSLHKVLQVAKNMDAINEWGSVVALTYIAAQRVFPDYNDMADAKSLLESITRSFGYHYGEAKKVRVNTISQSPTVTTAGSGVKGFDAFINYAEDMSPLGNASALDCANYCITMFSDLTKYVTMQNLFHDGGFSNTGVTKKVIDKFS